VFRKTRRPPTVVDSRTISLGGREVAYVVKRSQRARYVRIEVSRDNGVVVVVPRRYRIDDVASLLKEKGSWVVRKLAGSEAAPPGPVGRNLKGGDLVPYLGRDLELLVRKDGNRWPVAKLEGGRLLVSLGVSDSDPGAAVERWYRAQAERLIGRKAEEVSASLGLPYARLTIRGQRTRWGSCSQKGTLSFNWKLMMAPEPIIDYVVVHEICHLREMNHSRNFWKLVAENCPQWREHRKWLKEQESHLVAIFHA